MAEIATVSKKAASVIKQLKKYPLKADNPAIVIIVKTKETFLYF
jgi:hypothetical protein